MPLEITVSRDGGKDVTSIANAKVGAGSLSQAAWDAAGGVDIILFPSSDPYVDVINWTPAGFTAYPNVDAPLRIYADRRYQHNGRWNNAPDEVVTWRGQQTVKLPYIYWGRTDDGRGGGWQHTGPDHVFGFSTATDTTNANHSVIDGLFVKIVDAHWQSGHGWRNWVSSDLYGDVEATWNNNIVWITGQASGYIDSGAIWSVGTIAGALTVGFTLNAHNNILVSDLIPDEHGYKVDAAINYLSATVNTRFTAHWTNNIFASTTFDQVLNPPLLGTVDYTGSDYNAADASLSPSPTEHSIEDLVLADEIEDAFGGDFRLKSGPVRIRTSGTNTLAVDARGKRRVSGTAMGPIEPDNPKQFLHRSHVLKRARI